MNDENEYIDQYFGTPEVDDFFEELDKIHRQGFRGGFVVGVIAASVIAVIIAIIMQLC